MDRGQTSATAARVGTLQVLRDRNFLPYFVGNLLSNCGTWFQNIAQTLLVYRLTGSVLLVGVVNFAQFAGVFLVGPLSGVAADRFDRRRVLLWTQMVSAALTALLAALAFVDLVTAPVVIGIALLMGVAQAFGVPSMLAFVPQLVPPSHLGAAVALNVITFNVARAVGPVLGALVVARFGLAVAFTCNALSFAALVAALLVIRPRPVDAHAGGPAPRLRDSVATLFSRPTLLVLFAVGATASIGVDPVTTLTPVFATDVFGQPDTLVGWFVGAYGAGAVLAAFVIASRPAATPVHLAGYLAGLVIGMSVFARSSWLPLAFVALAVSGFAFIGAAASALTRVQATIADAEQGRMMALWTIAFTGPRPIASLIDGAVAEQTNVQLATHLLTVPMAVVAVAILVRAWRGAGRRATTAAA